MSQKIEQNPLRFLFYFEKVSLRYKLFSRKIESSLSSWYYAEACKEWRVPISTVERLGNIASNSEEALTSLCSIYPARGSNPKPKCLLPLRQILKTFFLGFV